MKIKDNGKEINIRDSITKIIPEGDNNPITITPYVNTENERSVQLSFKDSYLFDNILSDTLDIEKNNEKISINTKDNGSGGSSGATNNSIEIYEIKYFDLDNKTYTDRYLEIAMNNLSIGKITLLKIGITYFYPTYLSDYAIFCYTVIYYKMKMTIFICKLYKGVSATIEYYPLETTTVDSDEYNDIF